MDRTFSDRFSREERRQVGRHCTVQIGLEIRSEIDISQTHTVVAKNGIVEPDIKAGIQICVTVLDKHPKRSQGRLERQIVSGNCQASVNSSRIENVKVEGVQIDPKT